MSKTTIIILFFLLITGLIIASYLGYLETLTDLLNPNTESTNPGLYMQVTSHLENWIQISTNNPTAEYIINIEVKNIDLTESTSATINLEIKNQTQIVKKETIEIGIINQNQAKNITRKYQLGEGTYEASYTLRSTTKIWDTYTHNFKIGIPRNGMGDHVRFYITPNHPSIQTHLITTGTDLNTIYSWVSDNISYEFDSDIQGESDFWQFPHETLTLKTGDCEDQAFLLASLIRASGTEATDIFVALGTVGSEGHAWVIIKTPIGWRTLEPTKEGIIDRILTDIFEFQNTQTRNYYFASNDIYFEEINPNNNHSFINQQFTGWYTNNQKINETRITVKINQPVKIKITVTNTGYHTYFGFIQIKIQKDIVMRPDSTLINKSFPLILNPNNTTQLEFTFSPDEITEDTLLKCRQYYYQTFSCFSQVYNPEDANIRECIFTTS